MSRWSRRPSQYEVDCAEAQDAALVREADQSVRPTLADIPIKDGLAEIEALFNKPTANLPPTTDQPTANHRPTRPSNFCTRRISYKVPNPSKVNKLNDLIKENAHLFEVAFKTIRDLLIETETPTKDYNYVQRQIIGEVCRRLNPMYLTDNMIRRTCKTVYASVYAMHTACRLDELTDAAVECADFKHRYHCVVLPIDGKLTHLEFIGENNTADRRLPGVWLNVTLRDQSSIRVPISLNKFSQRQIEACVLTPKELAVFTRRLPEDHPDFWFEKSRRAGNLQHCTGPNKVVFLGDEHTIEQDIHRARSIMARLHRPLTTIVEGRQLCGSLVFAKSKDAETPAKPISVTHVAPTAGKPGNGGKATLAYQAIALPEGQKVSVYDAIERARHDHPKAIYTENIEALPYMVAHHLKVDVLTPAKGLVAENAAPTLDDAVDEVCASDPTSTIRWKIRENRVVRAKQSTNDLSHLPGRNGFLSREARNYLDKEYPSADDRDSLASVASILASLDQRIVDALYLEGGDVEALQRYVFSGCVSDRYHIDPDGLPSQRVAHGLLNACSAMIEQWRALTDWLARSFDSGKVAGAAKELMRWMIQRTQRTRRATPIVWA